jgi:cobalt-zinc-cadmium resistance protein CzcA
MLDGRSSGLPTGNRPPGILAKSVLAALDARFAVLFVTLLLAALGFWCFLNVSVDAVPDISNIQVAVTANARGFSPQEIEQYVTFPIELSLQSLPRLQYQRSISKYGLSQVTAIFEDGTDIYWARQQVNEKLKSALAQMPQNAGIDVFLGPIATGLGEIYQFEVRGPGYSMMQLRDILDWQIIPALKTVPGVDSVESMGGEAKEYQVWLQPEKLHGYRVMPGEVIDALRANNGNAGGGYVVENSDQILLRAEGMLKSTEDIGNVLVRRTLQGPIRVKDLGRVVIGKQLSTSIATENGRGQTVIGVVVMRKGENCKQVVERINNSIDSLRATLPPNIEIRTFYERNTLINRTISTVWHNLSYGAVLVLVILFLLLGNIRGGIIAALAIPLSLLGAMSFLNLSRTSANLLSLGALDFGILIDGSVVMVEHILTRLGDVRGRSLDKLAVVKYAACEVVSPITFAVLIITAVYLPILALPGVSGKTFQPMALTVIFGLITALLVALYVTPPLAAVFLKAATSKDALIMRLIRPTYRRVLLFCVRRPYQTALFAILTFGLSLLCLPHMGTEFIPVLKEGSLVLTVDRPVSGSLETAAEETKLIEKTILQFSEVERVVSRTGRSEIAFDPMGPDETDTYVILKPPEQWTGGVSQKEIEDKIANLLRQFIPGIVFSISQPIEQRMNELVAGAKGDVAVRILGSDLSKLRELAVSVANALSQVPGTAGLKIEQTMGLPVVTAKLDTEALAAYGVSARDALDTVVAAVGGKVVGTIFEGKPRYDLVVRFSPQSMERADDIGGLPVAMTGGDLVPIRQIATVTRSEQPAQISHRQGDRDITVQLNVRGRDLGGYVEAAQAAVKAAVVLPVGYRIEWGGQFENLREAQSRLFVLVPLALALIFILLYVLYGSLAPGLLIFSNVPFALSGGIVALMCRHMHLSVTAGVGFIALFGVAVLNGVVLVSTIRQLEEHQNLPPRQASILGAKQRLRPVLMTALVASLGFVPMALATSVGAEVQRPLATVVIGGLITSTNLTLLVVPSLYPLICRRRRRPNQSISAHAAGTN